MQRGRNTRKLLKSEKYSLKRLQPELMKRRISKAKNDVESQKTLDMHLYNSDTVKAEIIWTLKSVMDGFSVRSNDELNETLSAMFPDSKIAGSFIMARTKSMYAFNMIYILTSNLYCYQV